MIRKWNEPGMRGCLRNTAFLSMPKTRRSLSRSSDPVEALPTARSEKLFAGVFPVRRLDRGQSGQSSKTMVQFSPPFSSATILAG